VTGGRNAMAKAGVRMESAKGRTDPPGRRVQPKEGAGLAAGIPVFFRKRKKAGSAGRIAGRKRFYQGSSRAKRKREYRREGEGVR